MAIEPRVYSDAPPASHPIHIILAAYPIACFTGAFLTDIVYAETANMQWANFSAWLIVVGLAMGVLAAIAGIIEALLLRRVHMQRPGWPHTLGNALVLLLALVNAFVHSRDAYTSVVPTGLILSGVVAVLVLVTSWLGSVVTYRPRAMSDA